MKIKDLPKSDRPREKLIAKGAENLKDSELLAILLRTGTTGKNVIEIASQILSKYSKKRLLQMTFDDLSKISGIDSAKATTLLAAFELSKRALEVNDTNLPVINTAKDAAAQLTDMRDLKKEHFVVLYLNAKNQLVHKETISMGTLNANLVHPREVFEPALKYSAAQIIAAHNHPSGDPKPSDDDLELTNIMDKESEKFYVTTPIYYVNDKPHVGHAYTTVMADVFARYQRKIKGKDNVFFLTGTDEHGSKVAKSAASHNVSPQEYSDRISEEYKKIWKGLDISYDEFFRTTDPKHEKIVQDYLQQLYDKGYIYKSTYKGLYCVGCEKFLSFDEISNEACIYHPNVKLVEQEEENYFFKLKDFSADVLKEIKNKTYKILPPERENEIISKINGGINDVSISRAGVAWGIPLPWDKSHTVYVWVDALLNYYSATKIYEGKEKFWPPSLHLMAKDILWFHSLVWESLLLASNLELPKVIFAHGFFTVDGQKMSKTLGNVIDPADLVAEYGSDGARYLLISSFSFGNDGDISLYKFQEKYNADLANGIGNLASRIARLCETSGYINSNVPVNTISPEVEKFMEQYRPDEAVKSIWKRIADFDRLIGEDKPWKLESETLKGKLHYYVENILAIASDIEPFMPKTSQKITKIFSQKDIRKPESVFPRKL